MARTGGAISDKQAAFVKPEIELAQNPGLSPACNFSGDTSPTWLSAAPTDPGASVARPAVIAAVLRRGAEVVLNG
jgi:hypothetical protein